MPAVNVRVDQELWSAFEAQKPHFLSSTAHLNLLISQAVDASFTLGKPTAERTGVLPSKKVLNKEEDVDFSLRAEEAHISVAAIKSPPKRTNEIPGNLFAHEDLIRAYWKAKPSAKSAQAWKLLMTELTKLQDRYGDSVVRDQLVLAEANRWKGVSLLNYERFGMDRPNTPTQTSEAEWERLNNIRTPW